MSLDRRRSVGDQARRPGVQVRPAAPAARLRSTGRRRGRSLRVSFLCSRLCLRTRELTEKQSRQFAEPASGAARRGDGQHCISDQTWCVGLPDLGSVAGRPPLVTAGHHPAVVTGWRHPRTPAPFGACLHGNRRRARPFPTSPSRDSA
jgi:hypothetical protein